MLVMFLFFALILCIFCCILCLLGISRSCTPHQSTLQSTLALKLLHAMEMEGCQPDIITLNTILKIVCADDDLIDQVHLLFSRMSSVHRVVPDKISFTMVVQCSTRLKQFVHAGKTLGSVVELKS